MVRYFLAVEVIALALTILLAINDQFAGRHWWQLGVICALALFQAEVSRKIEKTRRLITNAPHVNMTSVWVFAGVIVLPPSLAGLVAVVVYFHLWARVWRKIGNRPVHRVVFSTVIIMLSAYTAAGVLDAGQPTHLVLSWADYALEVATLCLGALAALALSHTPYLVVLVLPPLLVLHRAVLVKQLEELATLDQKTGLLNATAWHEGAKNELSRAERQGDSFGVMMMDLDFFKRVNDTYGHLAGDEVLKAIARLLKDEIRDYDSAGRFGGEEFAVLIPNSTAEQVVRTAERLRHRVTELEILAPTDSGETVISGLSASIGVAIYPNSGITLEQLMLTADSAVYTAKSNGRNQVVTLST
jgi:diguanylate cyclase (GGDEF)-like protein